jgi:hypothetical protein
VAKLAPTLIERRVASDVLHVDPLVMGEGVAVFLDPEAPLEARKHVLQKWKREGFGLAAGAAAAALERLVPAAWANADEHAGPWRKLMAMDAMVSCGGLLEVVDPAHMQSGEHLDSVLLKFKARSPENVDAIARDQCLVGVLAYFATHAEVYAVEPTPTHILQGFLRDAVPKRRAIEEQPPRVNDTIGPLPPDVSGRDDDDEVQSSNYVAVGALQSGDSSNMSPFWDIGVDGTGEYVQVCRSKSGVHIAAIF